MITLISPLPSLLLTYLALFSTVPSAVIAACTPNTTSTTELQSLLTQGGSGYTLSLCPSQTYSLSDILNFTATHQEISTDNYPTDNTRATLVVSGFNISTAVQGVNAGLDGCTLRNIQIDGNRGDAPIYTGSNANIEMGGANANQTIEYVRSYDPRGWSCCHIAEGPFQCTNTTVQNNDIGPCGSSYFQNWADGISLSCMSSLVQNNVITDATDGGIVIFGAPFSTIRNNTISVKTRTMLGGINLVDVLPWLPQGNYSHTLVEDNTIYGGFATDYSNATLGTNNASAVIKIGIGIGPEIWFGTEYGSNQSRGGTVQNNILSGAFSFGMAVASAANFIISNNSFTGNVSFIGSYGVNCTTGTQTPHLPTALLEQSSTMNNVTIDMGTSTTSPGGAPGNSDDLSSFINGTALGLTCFDTLGTSAVAWPYGGGQVDSASISTTTTSIKPSGTNTGASAASSSPATSSQKSGGEKGVLFSFAGMLLLALLAIVPALSV